MYNVNENTSDHSFYSDASDTEQLPLNLCQINADEKIRVFLVKNCIYCTPLTDKREKYEIKKRISADRSRITSSSLIRISIE